MLACVSGHRSLNPTVVDREIEQSRVCLSLLRKLFGARTVMSPSCLGEDVWAAVTPYTSKPSNSDAETEGILTVNVADDCEPAKQRPYFITSILKCLSPSVPCSAGEEYM